MTSISASPVSNHAFAILVTLLFVLPSLILLNVLTPLRPSSLRYVYSRLSNSKAVEGCDYSYGRWVWDDDRNARFYSEDDCPFIDLGFQCKRCGRNDTDYLNWRWQPHGCKLPRFNASEMLERSRNKRVVFVGDSIGRGQWESLLCMLSAEVKNKSSVYEAYGNPITKHKGFLSIRFSDHNLTVEYYSTPFLVVVARPPPNAPRDTIRKAMRVDTPHWESKRWKGADVLVFNTGHWWREDKLSRLGMSFQTGESLNMTMDVKAAFQTTLHTIRDWTLSNMNLNSSFVFFRSFSPAHFMIGTRKTRCICDSWTGPETDHGKVEPDPWYNRVMSEAVRDMKKGREINQRTHFLNITYMSTLRRDGHPSRHREPEIRMQYANQQDCSHWCLPGVPDTWNELLYAYLMSHGFGTRTSI